MRGEMMSTIKAWLDDRGMDYVMVEGPQGKHFDIARIWGGKKTAHVERNNATGNILCWTDRATASKKVAYTSQKSVINNFLIDYFYGAYKEV